MENQQEALLRLQQQLKALAGRQQELQQDIGVLARSIEALLSEPAPGRVKDTYQSAPAVPPVAAPFEASTAEKEKMLQVSTPAPPVNPPATASRKRSNLEKYIGEHLINVVGIIILVVGVGIGVRYAIEHDLISPLTRIILGYVCGLVLLGFAVRMKAKYEPFSAVLLSGSMAILYFITYAAYAYYALIPQGVAFGFMVLITAFTVAAALHYNRQVIAHIGMVGAYAVPFLLSNKTGNVEFLFSYMAIINTGILVIAFRKYWKWLYYISFGFTWVIYGVWYFSSYSDSRYFGTALLAGLVFFVVFYVAFLAYKLVQREKFDYADVVLMLLNAFLFYGFGYAAVSEHAGGEKFLGLFTLLHALLHAIVAALLYRSRTADSNLFYFTAGLVLVFATIAIPVQLDGSWVTLLWIAETGLLYWIGRRFGVAYYEWLAYIMMVLAFGSLCIDWMDNEFSPWDVPDKGKHMPLMNIGFLTNMIFAGVLFFMFKLSKNDSLPTVLKTRVSLGSVINGIMGSMLLFVVYNAFAMEISGYWNRQFAASATGDVLLGQGYMEGHNANYLHLRDIWRMNYTVLFTAFLCYVSTKEMAGKILRYVSMVLGGLALLSILSNGFAALGALRQNWLSPASGEVPFGGMHYFMLHYATVACVAVLLWFLARLAQNQFRMVVMLSLHLAILALLSYELIHWLDIAGVAEGDKLGMSILWGSYSLFLIVLGIVRKMRYLRIGAIVLFAATLVKLFAYDLASLGTIAKTVVFVTLGVLLLIISFLYTKYRNVIGDETD